MKRNIAFIMLIIIMFNPVKKSKADTQNGLIDLTNYASGKNYIYFIYKDGYGTEMERWFADLYVDVDKIIIKEIDNGMGSTYTAYRMYSNQNITNYYYTPAYSGARERIIDSSPYIDSTSNDAVTQHIYDNNTTGNGIRHKVSIVTTLDIYNEDNEIVENANIGVDTSIDVGFTNYNDVINSNNSQCSEDIPYIKKFKVKKDGAGAMATHVMEWESSDVDTTTRAEIAIAYKVEASDSWIFNKKYNQGFTYLRTYNDKILSENGYFKIPLSTSSPDGTFKDSVTTCIIKSLRDNFGDAEAMALINSTDTNIKAYYIRNVKLVDGIYKTSKWVRCKIGGAYSIGNAGVVDENGNEYEDTEDYNVVDGEPTESADGGQISGGILGFITSVFDSIAKTMDMVFKSIEKLINGIGNFPILFEKLFNAMPSEISVIFVAGLTICVFLRVLKR